MRVVTIATLLAVPIACAAVLWANRGRKNAWALALALVGAGTLTGYLIYFATDPDARDSADIGGGGIILLAFLVLVIGALLSELRPYQQRAKEESCD